MAINVFDAEVSDCGVIVFEEVYVSVCGDVELVEDLHAETTIGIAIPGCFNVDLADRLASGDGEARPAELGWEELHCESFDEDELRSVEARGLGCIKFRLDMVQCELV